MASHRNGVLPISIQSVYSFQIIVPVVQRIERRFPNGKVAFLLDFADVLSKILPRASGSDGGYVGPHGIFLNPGDTIELPVNYCMQFVADGSAVFVLNSQTSKEEKLIAELEARGYQFAINSKPAREREEFQSVIARKKSRSPWMAGVITPSPGTA
ncbi:MAG: hypothetical protein AUG81_05645 [Verrucomicrobia bacterium 13_1_20CM_4_54_11]|nr:MAG: hypothetical protein AUG81_05645 [Verrucomicrobia bacterium 13_1_20CM_4_54_11]